MKIYIIVLAVFTLAACGSGQKLFERTTPDNGKVIVRKEFFSGIHYLYLEKKIGKQVQYSIIYDCECGVSNKISLKKTVILSNNTHSSWTSVTDTTGQPRLFADTVDTNRLVAPMEFMPITQEEISLLEEGVSKVEMACCKNPDKPISKIIGYVRIKSN